MTVDETANLSLDFMAPIIRQIDTLPEPIQARVADSARRAMAGWGLTDEILEVHNARVPHGAGVDFIRAIAAEVGDPAFALRAGSGARPEDWGLGGYLTRTASTFGQSFRVAAEFVTLMASGALVDFTVEGDVAVLRHRLRAGLSTGPLANDMVIAGYVAGGHAALGFVAPPSEVHFQHARPAYADVYTELFGCPVRFEQKHNAIIVPAAALDIPLPGADPVLHRVLRNHATDLMARLPERRSLAAMIRDLIVHDLQSGAPSLRALATTLTVSERTLRRRLSLEGHSISSLLEDVRRGEAARMLTQTEMSVSEIAFALGFAQPPAFHRAFRRWYGMAPLDYRRTTVTSVLQNLLRG